MKARTVLLTLAAVCVVLSGQALRTAAADQSQQLPEDLAEIINGLEERYNVPDFSAEFQQESVLKAMDIRDTANGKVWFQRPGKMRWEYEKPEPQTIITDSRELWIFRPLDNQVMVGKAPAYFSGGKGASFLTDIRLLSSQFDMAVAEKTDPDYHVVLLTPKNKTPDLDKTMMWINRGTYNIEKVVTYNQFGDETIMRFTSIGFNQDLDPTMFHFDVPEGADIIYLDNLE